jgi:site-specific recombinase XerD
MLHFVENLPPCQFARDREIQCLHCIFQFAITRKYITESPAAGVKHFDERRERPVKRMLAVEEEQRILEAAPPHLRVAIILLVQTGGRTYSGAVITMGTGGSRKPRHSPLRRC